MNPISYAIDQVMRKVPKEVLRMAFLRDVNYGNAIPVSVASCIREKVIESRVNVDCNLAGGHETTIPLNTVQPITVDAYNVIYRVPKALTQGRAITRVLGLVFGEGSVLGTAHLGLRAGNPMLDAAGGVLNSHLPIPNVQTHYASLIGENVVLVRENYSLPRNVFLRCWLENDENMTHIQPGTYKSYAKLVEYATKSHIYNELVVELDRGALHAGMDFGSIRDKIEGYSDAEEMYEEYFRDVWKKTAILNDHESKMRHIKMITGGLH